MLESISKRRVQNALKEPLDLTGSALRVESAERLAPGLGFAIEAGIGFIIGHMKCLRCGANAEWSGVESDSIPPQTEIACPNHGAIKLYGTAGSAEGVGDAEGCWTESYDQAQSTWRSAHLAMWWRQ